MNTPKKASSFQPVISVSQNDDITINMNEKIGKWTYGDFYRGFSKKINQETMVKLIDLAKFPLKKKTLDTEIAILTQLKHSRYIVHFMEYKYYEKTLAIVHEKYNAGNLKDYLDKSGPLPENFAVRLLMQLISGLRSLHDIKFNHCAVRPENILLHEEEDGSLTCKISNFVFAKNVEKDPKANFPYPYDSNYLAPEVLRDNQYHDSSDIWSLGVIYHQMLFGRLPWEGKDRTDLVDNIINKTADLHATEEVSDTSIDFINKCLQKDIKFRLQWKDVADHRLVFRALFQNEDGTFRLHNEEFREFAPSKRHVMFGVRQSSLPGSPRRRNSLNTSSNFSQTPKTSTIRMRQDLNMSGMSTFSQFANNARSGTPELNEMIVPKVGLSSFGNQRSEPNSANIQPVRNLSPIGKEARERDISPIAYRNRNATPEPADSELVEARAAPESIQELGSQRDIETQSQKEVKSKTHSRTVSNAGSKAGSRTNLSSSPVKKTSKPASQAGSRSNLSSPVKADPEFATHLLAKVGTTEDYFEAKFLNKEELDSPGPFSKKTFVKPFKWLANKAEIVSEIYELAMKNKQHPCYDRIVQTLNEETTEWNTINLVSVMQKQFTETVECANKKEEKNMVWPKNLKTGHSLAKQAKSQKIEKLVEDIVAAITAQTERGKATNMENMIQIAANLKILREFEEIGDSVMKELDTMKNSLIIFYRKRDLSHLKYLLLVRNLA